MAKAEFKVVDALKAPHGGVILRLRLDRGDPPTIRQLKGAELLARGPEGVERRIRVKGFPLFAGKPSNERLARTGRIDLHVIDDSDGAAASPIAHSWRILRN